MRETILQLEEGYAALHGKEAGSSIDWMYFHVLRAGTLPLQEAARIGRPWPLSYHCAGAERSIIAATTALAAARQRAAAARATECIAMVREQGEVICYDMPRDRIQESARPAILIARVGAYECTGVFIFEQDAEGEALQQDSIDFANLWQILIDVCPQLKE